MSGYSDALVRGLPPGDTERSRRRVSPLIQGDWTRLARFFWVFRAAGIPGLGDRNSGPDDLAGPAAPSPDGAGYGRAGGGEAGGGPRWAAATRLGTTIRHASVTSSRISGAAKLSIHASIHW